MPLGTNVFARDWDLLVVLDACRVNAMRAAADDYPFLGEVESVWSVGSTSIEWLALTFREQYRAAIEQTAYVTGNGQFDRVFRERRTPPHIAAAPFGPSFERYGVVEPEAFAHLDPVYEYAFDDDLGVVPPRPMTDRAIATDREHGPDRMIVHYLQPHAPYIGVEDPPENALAALSHGDLDRETVRELHEATLRYVLEDVALLLENVDAERVAITADHGEGFGEWTFYSHNIGCPHPAVRKVPWVETTATDERTHEPSHEQPGRVDADTADQLKRLGYV